jgi:hypothetical protein
VVQYQDTKLRGGFQVNYLKHGVWSGAGGQSLHQAPNKELLICPYYKFIILQNPFPPTMPVCSLANLPWPLQVDLWGSHQQESHFLSKLSYRFSLSPLSLNKQMNSDPAVQLIELRLFGFGPLSPIQIC